MAVTWPAATSVVALLGEVTRQSAMRPALAKRRDKEFMA
jgi:hypothetical protein